jgi:hypothetical protein
MAKNTVLAVDAIERSIHHLRGHKVMLDADLARLYRVTTGALNRQVKRNRRRFPGDFMFQLTAAEAAALGDGPARHGGRRRSLPYAFTEHGVVMLSSVLSSARAVAVNIQVVRVFVRLRQMLGARDEFARRLDRLEADVTSQKQENTRHFKMVFEAIRQLMVSADDDDDKEPIGFRTT